MLVASVLLASLVLQVVAVYFALRLIRVTGKSLAWGFIAAAIALMAFRRFLSLGHMFATGFDEQPALAVELVALLISALMVFGIERIAPFFVRRGSISYQLRESEARYGLIFENSPVAIWEGDFSEVKRLFDRLRSEGVSDFETYSAQHPEIIRQCAEQVRIEDVNRAAITLHGAGNKKELLTGLVKTFTPESLETFREVLIRLWRGDTAMQMDSFVRTLAGEPLQVFVNLTVCPDYEETLSKVFVSLIDITQRKQTEAALTASEQQFRSLAENSPDNIVRYDQQCRLIYYNPAMARALPVDPEKLLGKMPTEHGFGGLDISAEYERHIRSVLETGESSDLELTIPGSDDRPHFHLVRFTPERDANGNLVSVLGIGRDITELKLIDDALVFVAQHGWQADAENFFDALVQFLGKKFDVDYVLIDKLSEGLKVAESVALYAKGVIAPNIKYDLKNTPCENVMGQQVCLYTHDVQQQFPNDTLLAEMGVESYIGIPLWDSLEQPIGLIALLDSKPLPEDTPAIQVLQLVATRAAAELQRERSDRILRASEKRFHAIFNQSYQLIGLLSPDGTLLEANNTALKLAGVEESEVLGKLFWETPWWNHSAALQQQIREAVYEAAKGTFVRFEANHLDQDGNIHYVDFSLKPVTDSDGQVIQLIPEGRDITEFKQAEHERQVYAEFLVTMDRINRAVQSAVDLETMMRDVLDEVLDIFDCDRAFLMYPCDPAAAVWSVPMERTRPEYPGAGTLNEEIPMDEDVATTLKLLLNTSGVLKFGPGTDRPLPEEVSERYGFKSFMSIALYPKVGKAWQFGIHQCSYDRIWTEVEEKLLSEIGRRMADGLSSLLILRDLRESEARYQRMFDTANEGIWIQDENFVTTFINEHMAEMLGYSADELEGCKVTEFMSEEDAADHVRKMEERRRNISDIYERRMQRKDGTEVWMLISASPIFEGGRFHGSFAMLTDITGRKEAEQKLAASEQLFRTLVEHSPDYIARYDRELRRIYINPALQQQFPVSTDQAIGNQPTEFSPLIDPGRYMDHIRQALDTGSECSDELSYRKLDGEVRWAKSRFIPELGVDGKVATVMVISDDITERKRAEEDLVFSEEKFSKAFYASPNLMAITKPENGLIVDINETFSRIFGYTREECIGRRTDELHMWVDPQQRRKIVQKLKQAGSVLYEPVELRTKSGEIRSVIDSLVFINIDKQQFLLSVAADITDRRKAEEALRAHKQHLEEIVAQRTEALRLARDAAETANRAKSTFLANMSHELRTPLNAILGFSHMMQQDSGLSESQHETLDIINNSGEHLLKLINDVLEIAKIEAGKLQLQIADFDLHALVREVTDMMRLRAKQKGLQLELDQSSEFPRYIKGDEARMRQILVNLISNAVKFTEQGGVTVRLSVKDNARHHLLLEVKDSGPGIRPEDQRLLFMPFVQLPEGKMHVGTGLGLSIVQQFVQLMGGSVHVESSLGKGSLFRVELPLKEADEEEVVRLGGTGHGDVIGLVPGQPVRRILIAEDQRDNQLLLSRLMTDIGLEVRVAGNGEQCVQIFKEWKPDLIWMDRRMPVMDGVEATRRIRKLPEGAKVKIVAVTASAFKEQRDQLLAAGMDGFVRKPYQFNEIYDSLARQLGVELLYQDAGPREQRLPTLTSAMLAGVSDETLMALRDALALLDNARIAEVINRVAEQDKTLAQVLTRLADNYDYPAILDVLDSVISKD